MYYIKLLRFKEPCTFVLFLWQTDGRAQPTREDKVNFLMALTTAAAGQLPLQMLYFYKYLMKFAEENGTPHIDRDLLFYCEVQKFKVRMAT